MSNYMMSFRKVKDGLVCVHFPTSELGNSLLPAEIRDWLVNNTQLTWAVINNRRVGVLLSDEDALAFRLKWM